LLHKIFAIRLGLAVVEVKEIGWSSVLLGF